MLPKFALRSPLTGLTLGGLCACDSQRPTAAAPPATSPALAGPLWTVPSLEGVAVAVSDER